MKIQVRHSVFETNSSSQHSIAIIKPENLKGTIADHYGWELVSEWLKPGEKVEVNSPIVMGDDSIDFGRWPFRILSTMYEKAQYAIASYGTEEKFNEISQICEKLTGHGLKQPVQFENMYFYTTGLSEDDEIPEDHWLTKWEVSYDHTKGERYRVGDNGSRIYDVEYGGREEVPYYGSIDHQSVGLLQGFLERQNISLEEFLKDPRYVVIIDGDEYCAWQKMFDAGLCKEENFIETGLKNSDAYSYYCKKHNIVPDTEEE